MYLYSNFIYISSLRKFCLLVLLFKFVSVRGVEYFISADTHKTMMKWVNTLQVSLTIPSLIWRLSFVNGRFKVHREQKLS